LRQPFPDLVTAAPLPDEIKGLLGLTKKSVLYFGAYPGF
jgi:hypothetical protein